MKKASVSFVLIFLLAMLLAVGGCAEQPLTSSGDSSVGSSTSLQPSTSQSSSVEEVFYSITINNLQGGSVTVNKSSAKKGEIVTLGYSADAGYEFVGYVVKQGDTEITVTNGEFTMPAGNVSISANFFKN